MWLLLWVFFLFWPWLWLRERRGERRRQEAVSAVPTMASGCTERDGVWTFEYPEGEPVAVRADDVAHVLFEEFSESFNGFDNNCYYLFLTIRHQDGRKTRIRLDGCWNYPKHPTHWLVRRLEMFGGDIPGAIYAYDAGSSWLAFLAGGCLWGVVGFVLLLWLAA